MGFRKLQRLKPAKGGTKTLAFTYPTLICLSRKLQSSPDKQSIVLHSVMEPMVGLPSVMPSIPFSLDPIFTSPSSRELAFVQCTMPGQMDGKGYPVMMSGTSNQQRWNRR